MKRLNSAILTGTLLLGASLSAHAAATRACHQPPEGGSNTCLTIAPTVDVGCPIHVGIDVEMSRQDAQDLIDASGGNPFGTVIMANDHDDPNDDTSGLFEVFIAEGWPVAGDGGLSAEFYREVNYWNLDEDKDGRDEVYARVELHDHRSGDIPPRRFRSGIIRLDYGGCDAPG